MPPLEDEYEGFDTAAAAADIGSSLFGGPETDDRGHNEGGVGTDLTPGNTDALGKGETVNEEVAEPAAKTAPATAPDPTKPLDGANPAGTVPATQAPGQNSVGKVLPKSWKKDMGPEWEKASPALKDYVYEREANVMRGIQQYQNGYQAWDTLIKPFAPMLEAYPQVNPIQLMQGLMQTHLSLLDPRAPMETKTKIVGQLLAEYGISMTPDQAPAVDPALIQRLQRSEQQVQQLMAMQQNAQRQQYQAGVNTFVQQIDAFAADPKNKFFNDVQDDILRFINSGAATTLSDAYDLAIWANPAIRAKMLAEQQVKPPVVGQKPRADNGRFVNLDDNTPPPTRKAKVGSIDDTINAVVASHYSKH
jgi:hypothetical protein